jgi:hypothetical protein
MAGTLPAGLLAVVAFLFLTYRSIPVNVDAGYYIPIAREVMEGRTPTVDAATAYTPFVYYAYALWMRAFGEDTSTLMLLVYLVHLLNAVLLFAIVARILESRLLCTVLASIYFCAVMICEGFHVVLEPFQMVFVLAAFLVYLHNMVPLVRWSLAGVLLGISIMFKQYSAFILVGFVLTVAWDTFRAAPPAGRFRRAALAVATVLASAALPFLLFVMLTDATLLGALRCFGFVGDVAVAYVGAEEVSLAERAARIVKKMIRLNALFVPLLIYLVLLVHRRGRVDAASQVLPIFLFSAAPILVRQFYHYSQLYAPWSFVIAATSLAHIDWKPVTTGRRATWLLGVVWLCSFAVLPVAVFATPSFPGASRLAVAGSIGGFLAVVGASLLAWMFIGRRWRDPASYAALVFLMLAFEIVFLALKVPFRELAAHKTQQQAIASELAGVLPRGSEVFVVDHPALYALCDYRDPLGDYGFAVRAKMGPIVRDIASPRVEWLLVSAEHPLASSGHLEDAGFREVHSLRSTDLLVFRRPAM